MLRYIPTSESAGPLLIAALWRLARPSPAADDSQGVGSLVTALNGSVWLELDVTTEIVMHPDAHIGAILEVLAPWEQNGSLPAGTMAALEGWIEATRVLPAVTARTFVLWERFPALFRDMSKTRAELVALGLLEGGGL